MISTAIQITLQAIIPNTFLEMGDEKISLPFCTHREKGETEYVKTGIIGYDYECTVLIVDSTPESVEAYAAQIINALTGLTGTTTGGTIIDLVVFEGDNPEFDEESKNYYNILTFGIKTTNR